MQKNRQNEVDKWGDILKELKLANTLKAMEILQKQSAGITRNVKEFLEEISKRR